MRNTISVILSAFCILLAHSQDFSSGDLSGWKSIGAVSVVPSSYAPTILTGNAALLETGAGAVPIEQVFAFLESEGLEVESWGRLGPQGIDPRDHPSSVGSAIVSEFEITSDYIVANAWYLSNNKDSVGRDRCGRVYIFVSDDGGRGVGGGIGSGAIDERWESSGSPYLYQHNTKGGVGRGYTETRKVAYMVYEFEQNEADAGFAILVDSLPETSAP